MRKKNFKGRCEKRRLSKCTDICRTFDRIQTAYALRLEKDSKIREFGVNIELEGELYEAYTTDFVCTKTDGRKMVRECVERRLISKPLTVKLLDLSREYWTKKGVIDWGIVVDE